MNHIIHTFAKITEIRDYLIKNNVDDTLLSMFDLQKYKNCNLVKTYLSHDEKDPENIYYKYQDVGDDMMLYYIDINDTLEKSIMCFVGILDYYKDNILQIICDKLRKPMSTVEFQRFPDSAKLNKIPLEDIHYTYHDGYPSKKNGLL